MELQKAMQDIIAAWQRNKAQKEELQKKFDWDTARLATNYKQEEQKKLDADFLRIDQETKDKVKKIRDTFVDDLLKNRMPVLAPSEKQQLDTLKYVRPSKQELEFLLKQNIEKFDYSMARALVKIGEDSGFKISGGGLPRDPSEMIEAVDSIASGFNRAQEADPVDRDFMIGALMDQVPRVIAGMSQYDENGDLKPITVEDAG